jgi:heterodisulfide reductase subunit A-like polyferredoxin
MDCSQHPYPEDGRAELNENIKLYTYPSREGGRHIGNFTVQIRRKSKYVTRKVHGAASA